MFSLSRTFEKLKNELNSIPLTTLNSEETLNLSRKLDYFVNNYQNKKQSVIKISADINDATLTINASGELDIYTSEKMTTFINFNKHKWSKVNLLNIDLSKIDFFDTSGIHAIILLMLDFRDMNVSINSLKVSSNAYEIINIMGFRSILYNYYGKSILVKNTD